MTRVGLLVFQLLTAQTPTPEATPPEDAAVEAAPRVEGPADTERLYRLGTAFLKQGQPQKAVKPLTKLVEQAPDLLAPKLALARALRLTGDTDKARALLDAAIETWPKEEGLRAERGQLARMLDERDTAIAQFALATELSPKDAELRFNLGEALQRAGKTDEAITTYRAAL
jgi:Flp pilus assembly protein TadD